jgi:hypothetical protein
METALQEASRMVDWAWGTLGAGRYSDAEWNLKRFFELYNNNRPTASSADKATFDTLSIRANLAYSMLKERQMWTSANAGSAGFTPTATQARIAEAQAEAKRAADLAAAQAAKMGETRLQRQAGYQSSEVVEGGKREMADAPNVYRDALSANMLGLPLWGWALGGAAVIYLWGRR